jgi:ABC-type glycerol-3-phosphate transport system substrate-binding protein
MESSLGRPEETTTVWKKLAIIVVVLSLLPLSSAVAAQGQTLQVWLALPSESAAVLTDAVKAFEDQTGVTVTVKQVDQPVLLQTAQTTIKSGDTAPDVIITSSSLAEPLLQFNLVAQGGSSGTFFLADLLNGLPKLLDQRCSNTALKECLWSGVSSTLPLPVPDDAAIERTAKWLCEGSTWLPFCPKGSLPGLPISWGFTLYLLNAQWLAQNGLEPPTTAQGVLDIRGKYGLDLTQAEEGSIQTVSQAGSPSVYVLSSTFLVGDPGAVMRSLASFQDAGYVPVLDVDVDTVYISASSPNLDLARNFAQFVSGDTDLRAGLLDNAQRLPVFTSDEVVKVGIDSDAALITLRALTLLTTYSGLAY